MYLSASSTPFKLRCPGCSQDTVAGEIFTDIDLLHLRPGITTCSACKARFTYGLVGFRIFVIGLSAFAVLSVLALATLDKPLGGHPLALPLACALSVLIGAFALPLGGLELVE